MFNRIVFVSHKYKNVYIIKNIISHILILSTDTNIEQSTQKQIPIEKTFQSKRLFNRKFFSIEKT